MRILRTAEAERGIKVENEYVDLIFDSVKGLSYSAVTFLLDGNIVCIPKSQLEGNGDGLHVGDTDVEVEITEWFALKKELI